MVLALLVLIQPEGQDRFAFQRAIDQGDVQDWPIRMQHTSKCNVKVDEDFYQQVVKFCNNTYDGDVYVKHQIDKLWTLLCQWTNFFINRQRFYC